MNIFRIVKLGHRKTTTKKKEADEKDENHDEEKGKEVGSEIKLF